MVFSYFQTILLYFPKVEILAKSPENTQKPCQGSGVGVPGGCFMDVVRVHGVCRECGEILTLVLEVCVFEIECYIGSWYLSEWCSARLCRRLTV